MTSKIDLICSHLPDKVLSNDQLAKASKGETAAALYRLSGIKQRHIAAATETPADLAFQAAEKLFRQQPALRQQLDALLFCSEGLDHKAPATACLLHYRLNLPPHCLSMDIPGGCTGFTNGLLVATSLINSNSRIERVLLLTAEVVSKVLHPDDIHLRMLFGDGACATLVARSEQAGIGKFVSGTDGSGAQALRVERSGFRHPIDATWLNTHALVSQQMAYGRLHMQGDAILHFALSRVPTLIKDTLEANNLTRDDIDAFIFHQASKIVLRSLQRKCNISDNQFITCLENTGNTVSSSIPLALEQARKHQRVTPGQTIMLVSFGVGLSWGATVLTL